MPPLVHLFINHKNAEIAIMAMMFSGGAKGRTRGPKSLQEFSKKNGMKLVGYTFRLKNNVKIPPPQFSPIFRAGAAIDDVKMLSLESRKFN